MMKETDLTLIWLVDDKLIILIVKVGRAYRRRIACNHRGDVYMLQKAFKTCIGKLHGLSVGFDLCLL